MMLEPKHKPADDEAATRIYPDMPIYAGSEADFVAAVEKGLADIRAGRTVSHDEIVAEFRRNPSQK